MLQDGVRMGTGLEEKRGEGALHCLTRHEVNI